MSRWMERPEHSRSRSQGKRRGRVRKSVCLTQESLEDRITPATAMAPPTVLDPTALLRVDQASYTIRGALQSAAKNGTTIQAYRDSNQNGVYDAGQDALAGSAAVVKGGTSFAVPVNLQQDAANQFFLVAVDGKLRSAPVKTSLITEDSTAPTVAGITRLGAPLTNAGSLEFRVDFSEPVTGVDASDFQVIRSGSVTGGAVSVSGSGASYTVTLDGLGGAGTLGLSLVDNDTIRDVLTSGTQAHALGGGGLGNGNFTTGGLFTIDRVAPLVESISRAGAVTTTGGAVDFTVKFSEDVTGVDATDFGLTTSGLSGASITGVSGSGSTY